MNKKQISLSSNSILFISLFLLSCSDGNSQNNSQQVNNSSVDSLLIKEESSTQTLIANFKSGIGTIIPIGKKLNLAGIPAENKTDIKILNYGFSKYVEVKNIKNKISNDEIYFQVALNYNFYIDKIKQYDSNLYTDSYFHGNRWILIDEHGTYCEPLMSYTTNKDSTMNLYYDGNNPTAMHIPFKVKDGYHISHIVNFKVPSTFSPYLLIYKIKVIGSDIFAVAFMFPQQ